MRSLVRYPLTLCVLSLFSLLFVPIENASAAEIRSDFEEYLETLPGEARVPVIIYLEEQADIASLDLELKREKATRQVRHDRIVRSLKEVASRTQPELVKYLKEAERAGHVTGFTPYWIANIIVVEATKTEINRLLSRNEIDFIEPNFKFELIDPVTSGAGDPKIRGIGVTPGLKAINADRVWKELGITGAGRVVANLDTGVDGNHPALASRWRGTLPGVHWSEAWLDNVHGGSQFPVDFYSHGTHVMGTITGLGEATGDTIGVAFGAYWIACNSIDQGAGPEFDNDVIEAFQWFADPDGDPGTVDDVPDVVQNSWRINESFWSSPPYTDCDSRWWEVIDNCEAAGVVVTFSAGNEGPGSETIGSPPDRADTPLNCYAIGAVDATNYSYPYPIAGFSSRGPSGCVTNFPIKPEVSAPGVDVYSSVPGGGYQGGWSGTSMSGPHVAGVVGLMREANPDLTVDEIKFILMETAHDFGDPGDDNTYGMGFIDAYEAVFMVMGGIGYLVGTVTDANTGDPIPADLEIVGSTRQTTADPLTGLYSFVLQGDSTYTVQASYFGYDSMEQVIFVAPDDTTTLDFQMVASPSGNLAGLVMDVDHGLPIEGATVEIVDTPIQPSGSSSRGVYYFPTIPGPDLYTVQATAPGYGSNSELKLIGTDELNLLALPLESGFSDNMEGGINGWTHYIVTPTYLDEWHQSTQRNHTSGGTTSWKCGSTGGGNYSDYLDAGLESPTIDLQDNSKLLFWHWMDAEISSGSEAWDGAIVEISINGGPFNQITPVGGYPYTIVSNPASPFSGGTPCFSGRHDWKQEEFDLAGYSGDAVIRFRFGTDGFVTEEGWYIDDVIIAPDAQTQAVSIMFLPDDENIVIGPSGGSFGYSMALVNNTRDEQIFDWWIDVSRSGGFIYGPLESYTDTLSAGETVLTTGLVQDVPDWVPVNRYNYNGKVGTLPGIVEAISSFQFVKSGISPSGNRKIEDWYLQRNSE
jgi:subtilisin family serine protease